MKTLVIPKPGVFFSFQAYSEHKVYISLTWRVTLFLESVFFCPLPVDPLPYFIYAGATNKCNFVFVSCFQSDSPFYLVKSTTAGGDATGIHKLKALQIRRAALAANIVFEDFGRCDWLHFKITVNWNG